MKKANHAVLSVTLMFVCIMVGFFIGRITPQSQITKQDLSKMDNQYTVSSSQVNSAEPVNDGKININTATSRQLQMLPNIGEILAERIIAYREQNGPFSTIEDLVFVKGIGDQRMEELRQYITVGG